MTAVVPTHRRPAMLRRAVQAVMDQDYDGHVECVVVFDKSHPEPVSVVVPEGRSLLLVENTRTPGLAGARNTGVLASRGDLVGFCDDDDEWLPGKVSAQVALLRSQPETGVVATGIFVHRRGRDICRPGPQAPTTFGDFLADRVMEINPCTVLARRHLLVGEIGLVDENVPGGYGEDYEWLLRAARTGPVVNVPEPLVRIHWHEESFYSQRWQTMLDGLEYLLARYPEFAAVPAGLARIEGQMALALAGLGHYRQSLALAATALRRQPSTRHAWAALLVCSHVLSAAQVVALARRRGRGV